MTPSPSGPEPLTLIANAAIIDNQRILSPAVITIADGRVLDISSHVSRTSGERRLDVSEMVLFPGLTNAHCHLELTAAGTLTETAFVPWIGEVLRAKQSLATEAVKSGIRNGMRRLLHSGVTTVLDHISPSVAPEAYSDAPIKVACFGEVLGIDDLTARASYETLCRLRGDFPVPLYPTPHAVHSVAPQVLTRVLSERSGPLSIHMAESREEAEYFLHATGPLFEMMRGLAAARGGKFWHKPHAGRSAVDFLCEQGMDLSGLLLIHGNFLSTRDLEHLARVACLCVVHCPGAWEFFAQRLLPWEEMRRLEIPVALGTDSLAGNSELNMLFEIRKFTRRYPRTTLWELLPMVTTNALAAIGIAGRGQISVGWQADMIGFCAAAAEDPLTILTRRTAVDFAMIDGCVMVSQGNLTSKRTG